MLIVAIPKSASTSLMKTLGDLHGYRAKQISFRTAPVPSEMNLLYKYHSDMREISREQAETFGIHDRIYKQHLPPTENNLAKLQPIKKVILLRNIDHIVEAYFRAEKKGIHEHRNEFQSCETIEEWKTKAKDIGLTDDLERFRTRWIREAEIAPDNNLMRTYKNLVEKSKAVVNRIETFYKLPVSRRVRLSKKRYSGYSTFVDSMRIAHKRLKAAVNG